jgi:prepilin-type N-terminal cleavage/methylation domain-containing protein
MNAPLTNGFARGCRVATRGFSLIEVLIAVLVLGVGLLGLASVFPVVISQQRDATDVIRGGVASNAIRGQILANPEIATELLSQDGLADADEPDADGDRTPNDTNDATFDTLGPGEPVFGWHTQYNPTAPPSAAEPRFNPLTGYSYLWEADWAWGTNQTVNGRRYVEVGANLLQDYTDTGGVRFRDPGERNDANVPANLPDLPMAARLYPRAYSNPGDLRDGPLYVWDFVPRRTPSGSVEFAVFVRRIDTGIRLGGGVTLSETLADPGNFGVFAVGRDPATRLPTLDGTGEYSVPVSARAEPIPSGDYPFRPEFRGPSVGAGAARRDPRASQRGRPRARHRADARRAAGPGECRAAVRRQPGRGPHRRRGAGRQRRLGRPAGRARAAAQHARAQLRCLGRWGGLVLAVRGGAGGQAPPDRFHAARAGRCLRDGVQPVMRAPMSRTSLRAPARGAPARRAFTLSEIVVAIGLLAIVGVVVGTIFASVGDTVTQGREVSNLNRFVARVERTMRNDFENMVRENGFMVIRNETTSLYNGTNPTRLPVALTVTDPAPRPRRIDEIMFFAATSSPASAPRSTPT